MMFSPMSVKRETYVQADASEFERATDAWGAERRAIRFASECFLVEGMNAAQAAGFERRFGSWIVPVEHANGEFSATVHVQRAQASWFAELRLRNWVYQPFVAYEREYVHLAGIRFSAVYVRDERLGKLHVSDGEVGDVDGFVGGFENFFRAIASYRLFERGLIVLHSGAVEREGRGYVVFGRSGAGKSTLCKLADSVGFRVLSDELNAMPITADAIDARLWPLPFAGDFGQDGLTRAPCALSGVFALEQSDVDRRAELPTSRAVPRLVASCPYLNADPWYVDRLVDALTDFARRRPVETLEFTKSTTFATVLHA